MGQAGVTEAQAAFPTAKTIFLVEDDQGIGDFLAWAIEKASKQATSFHPH